MTATHHRHDCKHGLPTAARVRVRRRRRPRAAVDKACSEACLPFQTIVDDSGRMNYIACAHP